MLLLALLPPLAGFLAAGCVAFFCCTLIVPLRRFALGVSLWFAIWAVFTPATFLVNTLALGLLAQSHAHEIVPINALAWHHVKTLALANAVLIGTLATLFSLLHGWLIRRITLAMFRLYLTAIAVVVALLTALLTCTVLAANGTRMTFLTAAFLLALAAVPILARICYRKPADFRSMRP